jgi:site-specific DNA-methyltransferase (adenine-specific)
MNQELQPFINNLFCDDCLNFLPKLPSESIDLILIDPPYFNFVNEEWDKSYKDLQDFQNFIEKVAIELQRVLKPTGSFYFFTSWNINAYCQIILDKYFKLLNNLVWFKSDDRTIANQNSFNKFANCTERILFYESKALFPMREAPTSFFDIKRYLFDEFLAFRNQFKSKEQAVQKLQEYTGTSAMWRHWFSLGTQFVFPNATHYSNLQKTGFFKKDYQELWEQYQEELPKYTRKWNGKSQDDKKEIIKTCNVIKSNQRRNEDKIHPTQKPIDLLCKLIELTTDENDVVLDCFSGSGSTGVAANLLKRNFILCEKSKEYYDKSVARLARETREDKII